MNVLSKGLGAIVASFLLATSSNAAVTVDPETGGDFTFYWFDGLGPIDEIVGFFPETEWSMSVATDSNLSLVAAEDGFIPGDEFALVFDGVVTPWDTETTTSDGYFRGASSLFLSAGLHTFSFNVTALAFNPDAGEPYMSGAAFAEFGVIPVPATLPLLLGGFGLFAFLRRHARDHRRAA